MDLMTIGFSRRAFKGRSDAFTGAALSLVAPRWSDHPAQRVGTAKAHTSASTQFTQDA